MNNVISNAGNHTTQKPDELMHLIADMLTKYGLHIQYSGYDDPGLFEITDIKDAGCRVAVSHDGEVQLDWTPAARGDTDPQAIADMAASLLTGNPAGSGRNSPGRGTESGTFKGMVAKDLKARGFDVRLEVFRDERAFHALAVIVATISGRTDSSKVTIADEGNLLWERDYWSGHVQTCGEPECPGHLTHLGEIAKDAATRLNNAISTFLLESASSFSGAYSTNRQEHGEKQVTHKCACGQGFPSPDDLSDHISMCFPIPDDDIGDDGKRHYEIWSDPRHGLRADTSDAAGAQARSAMSGVYLEEVDQA